MCMHAKLLQFVRFSRQEYWNELPCPLPGDLPDPGVESKSLTSLALAGRSLPLEPPGKPLYVRLDNTFPLVISASRPYLKSEH